MSKLRHREDKGLTSVAWKQNPGLTPSMFRFDLGVLVYDTLAIGITVT